MHALHNERALASRRSRACGRSAFGAKNNFVLPLQLANCVQSIMDDRGMLDCGRSSTAGVTRVSRSAMDLILSRFSAKCQETTNPLIFKDLSPFVA